MRWKTTAFLLVITIGIGAYISLYEIRQPSPEQRAQLAKHAVDIDPAVVTQLVIDLPQAKVTVTKEDQDWWLGPQRLRADGDLVNRIVNELAPLMAERTLSPSVDHPLDLKAYGLEPAVGWLTVVAHGQPSTLLIGDATAVHQNRYVKVSDRPQVHVVSSNLFDTANVAIEQFRDPMLLRVNTWLVEEVHATTPSSTIEVSRQKNDWSMRQPLVDQADRTEVTGWLNALGGLRIQRFVDDAPQIEQLAQWGFDHPILEVTLREQEAASRTVFFGAPLPDDGALTYAKRSDEPTLYAVATPEVQALIKDPHSLRATQCFDFFTGNVTKAQITREDASWTFERDGIQWKDPVSGAILDTARVEEFLNKLADMRLSGFVDDAPTDLAHYGVSADALAGAVVAVWTSDHTEPQRLFVGSIVEGGEGRYGLIEGRAAVVRLPTLITELLATTPEQFHPAPQPPAPAPASQSPASGP